MADTYEDAWRAVLMHCPMAGPFLAQQWVKKAYRAACDYGEWSWLRGEAEFIVSAAKSGTATVVRNSASVTGVGLTFASTDVDRQFRVTTGVPYTIAAVDTGTNTATLDRVYASTSDAAAAATVLDAYVSCPEDFGRFIGVTDPTNAWQLHLWMTQDELSRIDPQRSNSGNPYALVSRRLGSTTAMSNRVQYELWPYQLSDANYPYFYFKRPGTLSDSSVFAGPLAQRSEILVDAALSEVAMWPGVEGHKNPYFNATLAVAKQRQFREELARLEVLDQSIYLTWLTQTGLRALPYAPMDSNWMQSHE